MFAAELGIDGSSRWLDELLLHGQRECLVRDIDSPQADPYLSTAFHAPWTEVVRPMPYARQQRCIVRLLSSGPEDALVGAPTWGADDIPTPHSWKQVRPAWAAVAFPTRGPAVVEPGAWAGSETAALSMADARKLASGLPTALRYGQRGVAANGPSVAVVSTRLVTDWVASLRPSELPSGDGLAAIVAFRDQLPATAGGYAQLTFVASTTAPAPASSPAHAPAASPALALLPPALALSAPALALLPPIPALALSPRAASAPVALPAACAPSLAAAAAAASLAAASAATAAAADSEGYWAPAPPRRVVRASMVIPPPAPLPLAAALPLALASPPAGAPLFRQQRGEHGSNDGYVLVHKPLGPDGWPGFDAQ